ncbi:MAG: hypothetical protein K0B16_11310 [Burkholderiaceae bacterium]|nr:hypothetical protein [Burkholderiaceae bacterium]
MAQTTSFAIANDSGVAVRARINEVLAALASSNAGATAPATTAPGMLWFDTGVTPPTLRRRNAANDGWQAERDPVRMYLDSARVTLRSADGAETLADFLAGGGAYLRHDNVSRIWTTATGAEIYGALEVDTINGAALAGGFTATSDNDGTRSPAVSGGIYTPTPVGGNFRRIVNGGAFTFRPPSATGDYTLHVLMTNSATAGAVTFGSFTRVIGDALTTTEGHAFFITLEKHYGFTRAIVGALQ